MRTADEAVQTPLSDLSPSVGTSESSRGSPAPPVGHPEGDAVVGGGGERNVSSEQDLYTSSNNSVLSTLTNQGLGSVHRALSSVFEASLIGYNNSNEDRGENGSELRVRGAAWRGKHAGDETLLTPGKHLTLNLTMTDFDAALNATGTRGHQGSAEVTARQEGGGILSLLLRSAGGAVAGEEEVEDKEVDGGSNSSSSIFDQALSSFTLNSEGHSGVLGTIPGNPGGDPGGGGGGGSVAGEGGATYLVLGGQETVYLSSLAHNSSFQTASSLHTAAAAAFANDTSTAGEHLLFADYPQHLLDFAVFCCVLFIVLGVPANLITIIALVKCKKVHNATAVFIINLTLSDLMFGVFNLPLAASLFVHRAWVHTGFLCLLFPFLRYGLVAVSVFTVLAITINRYVMIAHPRLYHRLYTRTLLAVMVVSTWVGAFGALVPTVLEVWGTFGLDPKIGSCTILPDNDGRSPKEFLFVFAFVLPCVAICVCYARIFCIVHRADKQSHSHGQNIIRANGKQGSKQSKQTGSGRGRKKNKQDGKGRGGGEGGCQQVVEVKQVGVHTLSEQLQVETLVKLSSSTNSVRVEILEPIGAPDDTPAPSGTGNSDGSGGVGSVGVVGGGGDSDKLPSPGVGASLLRTEVNGVSGHSGDEVGEVEAISPIRICPPSAPESPTSDVTDAGAERRTSNESVKGAFSQLRGTFRRARKGSLLTRQTALSPKDRRLLKMILVIFLSFVACYLPITLVKTFSKDDDPVLNILGLLLIYLTTCINPIIYVVMSSEYRQAYLGLLSCRLGSDAVNRSLTKIS